jgi:hypothetical protein
MHLAIKEMQSKNHTKLSSHLTMKIRTEVPEKTKLTHCVNCFLCCAEALKFVVSSFVNFCFCFLCFGLFCFCFFFPKYHCLFQGPEVIPLCLLQVAIEFQVLH